MKVNKNLIDDIVTTHSELIDEIKNGNQKSINNIMGKIMQDACKNKHIQISALESRKYLLDLIGVQEIQKEIKEKEVKKNLFRYSINNNIGKDSSGNFVTDVVYSILTEEFSIDNINLTLGQLENSNKEQHKRLLKIINSQYINR